MDQQTPYRRPLRRTRTATHPEGHLRRLDENSVAEGFGHHGCSTLIDRGSTVDGRQSGMTGRSSAIAAGGLFLAVGQQTGCLQTFVVLSSRTSASAPSELTLSPQCRHGNPWSAPPLSAQFISESEFLQQKCERPNRLIRTCQPPLPPLAL